MTLMKDHPLRLQEAALLLALRDQEGTIRTGSVYQLALGGALVAELLVERRIVVETEGRRDLVRAVNTRRLGEPVLDDALAAISAAERPQTVQRWVQKLAGMKRLKHRIAEGLCRARVLRAVEGRVLFVFNRTVYPEIDHGPEGRLVERIRKAVLSEAPIADARLVILIALAQGTGLLGSALDRKEIRARKDRLKQIGRGEVVSRAVKDAVAATNAALMTAAIIPAIVASSSS